MALSMGEIVHAGCSAAFAILLNAIALLIILPYETASWALRCGHSKRRHAKSIAITGATSGIGEALALQYAAPGVHLALSGRNTTALASMAAACTAKGAVVLTRAFDVAADADAAAAWLAAADAAAPVDLVIANAGISEGTAGGLRDVDQLETAARALLHTNVIGVVNTLFPLLKAMRDRGSGQLVIMSSVAGYMPMGSSAAYSTSKAAVRSYGEALRLVLRRDGVHVNVICPGYVESPMTKINKVHFENTNQCSNRRFFAVFGVRLYFLSLGRSPKLSKPPPPLPPCHFLYLFLLLHCCTCSTTCLGSSLCPRPWA